MSYLVVPLSSPAFHVLKVTDLERRERAVNEVAAIWECWTSENFMDERWVKKLD